jgi:predicted nucleic acid-binding protein
VKIFLDTSVLVPVFVPGHEHHERSLSVFSVAHEETAYCAAHSLAEVYASLTRLPGKYRAAPDQVMTCLETIQERLTTVVLEVPEYVSAIRDAARMGISGGTIYDALLGACAVKAKVDVLYTWNARDFERLGMDVNQRVRIP